MSLDPYNIDFNGHKLDPYRVIDIFEIRHPAMQQIVKKALRQGSKHKDEEQDARDIITSAQRFLDMKAEERRWKTEPPLPFKEYAPPVSSLPVPPHPPFPPFQSVNGHRVASFPEGHPQEGLSYCVDCNAAEAEIDEPCKATNGGGS